MRSKGGTTVGTYVRERFVFSLTIRQPYHIVSKLVWQCLQNLTLLAKHTYQQDEDLRRRIK